MTAGIEQVTVDPRLLVSFGAAAAFDVLMPIAVIVWLRRKHRTPWWVFLLGALAWIVAQPLTRLPLVAFATAVLRSRLTTPRAEWTWIAVLSITAGLFEETARSLCFRYPLQDRRDWKTAVSLGAGHGGFESAVFVGLSVIGTLVTVLMIKSGTFPESAIPPDQLAAWQQQKAALIGMTWWHPLLGAWERLCSMAVHVSLSVLVLERFVRGRIAWYWLAVAYHSASNAVAVVVLKFAGPVAAEVALTVFLIVSLAIIFRFKPRESQPGPGPVPSAT